VWLSFLPLVRYVCHFWSDNARSRISQRCFL